MAKKHALTYIFSSQLNTHESDFRREHEEKIQFQKRVESSQQESERLKRENQSHMATIRHFESEVRDTYYLLCSFLGITCVKISIAPTMLSQLLITCFRNSLVAVKYCYALSGNQTFLGFVTDRLSKLISYYIL